MSSLKGCLMHSQDQNHGLGFKIMSSFIRCQLGEYWLYYVIAFAAPFNNMRTLKF